MTPSESLLASVLGAWRTLKADPVRILLPATGLLLLEVGVVMALRHWWSRTEPLLFALVVGVLLVTRAVLSAPLRALMIHAGARALDLRSRGVSRSAALLGVHLVVGPLGAVAGALFLLPALGIAGAAATYGWFTLSAFVVALGVLLATLASLATRAAFAYAPVEAVVVGRSGLDALRTALIRTAHDRVAPMVILFGGDTLVALGSLCFGAGALPGYPLSDLALLHRWRSSGREESP